MLSSRLCVKNLPKGADERKLREFFSKKGEVTDAKVMRTKDGKSRQFAFVGYRTKEEAEEALNYFNNTYMGTSKITCEIARKVGDPNAPRPWSRHSSTNKKKENNSSSIQPTSNVPEKHSKGSDLEKRSKESEVLDPKFQEFLEVMQPRAKAKIWSNDTIEVVDSRADGNNLDGNRTDLLEPNAQQEEEQPNVEIEDQLTDRDYLMSRIKKNWSDSESDDEDGEKHVSSTIEDSSIKLRLEDRNDGKGEALAVDNNLHDQAARESSHIEDSNAETTTPSNKELVLETARLYLYNLPYSTTENDLVELFSQYGDVSEVHLVLDKITKQPKGRGYVLFSLSECAVRALEELDSSIFQGRLLRIMPAKPQKSMSAECDEHDAEKKSFKKLREEQKKAVEARGDTRAWNSLFMRQDTVVEDIARKHGISKGDLLDREADDLAVRIALGETHVIAETKKALSQAGVNVEALEAYGLKKKDKSKRSNHVILVKNLPFSSSSEDLASMFGKFGSLDKVILPPTRVLALVVFLQASEARAAFKSLAYKRYRDVPLYLEWAPDDILSPTSTSSSDVPRGVVSDRIVNKIVVEQTREGALDLDPDRVESRSVFVKNLNFKTSDESLRQHFLSNMKSGEIKSAKVQRHIKNGEYLSKGFGFIEFDSVDTASTVCKDMQGTVLDGHALILQISQAKRDGQGPKETANGRSLTKLIVRNVAFTATKKDLKQLFSPFGQIKSVRLPKKMDGNVQGFAFVEYVTKQEAQSAMQALSNTHLYGRHLVIERAKVEDTLEERRAKEAIHFAYTQDGSKKRKSVNPASDSSGSVKHFKL